MRILRIRLKVWDYYSKVFYYSDCNRYFYIFCGLSWFSNTSPFSSYLFEYRHGWASLIITNPTSPVTLDNPRAIKSRGSCVLMTCWLLEWHKNKVLAARLQPRPPILQIVLRTISWWIVVAVAVFRGRWYCFPSPSPLPAPVTGQSDVPPLLLYSKLSGVAQEIGVTWGASLTQKYP